MESSSAVCNRLLPRLAPACACARGGVIEAGTTATCLLRLASPCWAGCGGLFQSSAPRRRRANSTKDPREVDDGGRDKQPQVRRGGGRPRSRHHTARIWGQLDQGALSGDKSHAALAPVLRLSCAALVCLSICFCALLVPLGRRSDATWALCRPWRSWVGVREVSAKAAGARRMRVRARRASVRNALAG